MKVILITGNTFLLRREIKHLGGFWYGNKKGWLVPIERTKEAVDLAYDKGFYTEELDVDFNPFRKMTMEEIRAYRQERANRKAARLIKSAEIRERDAEILNKQVEPYVSDWSFVTQPITSNSGGRAFARFREKINNKIDRKYGLINEAKDLRDRAEILANSVSVKGDAERRREKMRQALDEKIKIGSRVNYKLFVNGTGTVVRVNKKSYTIKLDEGRKISVDKIMVDFIE
jgi:hypothetical protein